MAFNVRRDFNLNGKPPKLIGDYIVGHTLGIGNFGKVKLGIHSKTKQKVWQTCMHYLFPGISLYILC
jgi:hypothetical protein